MLSLFLSVRLPEEAGRWINKLLRKSPHVKVLMDEEGHPRFFFFILMNFSQLGVNRVTALQPAGRGLGAAPHFRVGKRLPPPSGLF